MTRHVAAFQSQHPGVHLDLNVTNTYVDFSTMEADITVRPAQTLAPDLAGEKACELLLHVYGTPRYLEQNRGTGYGAHKWLGVAPPISATMVGEWQERNLPDSAIVLKSNSFLGLRDVAETGLGLALLPCCLGDPSPSLIRAEIFPEAMETSIWVATHKDMIGSAKVHSIISWFAAAIGEDSDLFEGRREEPDQTPP
jgi:DNA-binding transcriptional LysR family regulator